MKREAAAARGVVVPLPLPRRRRPFTPEQHAAIEAWVDHQIQVMKRRADEELEATLAVVHAPVAPCPPPPTRHRGTAPSPKRVVDAQAELLGRIGLDVGVAWHTCWACRLDLQTAPQLAHIQAVRDGGTNDPSNFFLLCASCHFEQPDEDPREAQERWLKLHMSFDELVVARIAAARKRGDVDEVATWVEDMGRRVRR